MQKLFSLIKCIVLRQVLTKNMFLWPRPRPQSWHNTITGMLEVPTDPFPSWSLPHSCPWQSVLIVFIVDKFHLRNTTSFPFWKRREEHFFYTSSYFWIQLKSGFNFQVRKDLIKLIQKPLFSFKIGSTWQVHTPSSREGLHEPQLAFNRRAPSFSPSHSPPSRTFCTAQCSRPSARLRALLDVS